MLASKGSPVGRRKLAPLRATGPGEGKGALAEGETHSLAQEVPALILRGPPFRGEA